MHPKNIYAHRRPNFAQLKLLVDGAHSSANDDQPRELQHHTKDGVGIDFKDPEELRQLTCALLLNDFNLVVSLPPDRLCPIIPGRLDYCLWLIDILNLNTKLDGSGSGILVIDIGTGSSAIYPLLFSKLLKDATFIATEADEASYKSAVQNVSQNELEDKITVHKTCTTDCQILPIQLIKSEKNRNKLSITMCNPPFYSSQNEIESLRAKKDTLPEAVCTGSQVEMVCPGGEEAFIEKIMRDSLVIGNQTRWFTSLCGKYTTLSPIIRLYKSLGGNNYAVTELTQGRTRRWVIGWSWQHHRLPNRITRSLGEPGPRLKGSSEFLPPANQLEYYFSSVTTDEQSSQKQEEKISDRINNSLGLIEGCSFDKENIAGCWNVSLYQNSWTRSQRRKRKFMTTAKPASSNLSSTDTSKIISMSDQVKSQDQDQKEPILIVKISLNRYRLPTTNNQAENTSPTQITSPSSPKHKPPASDNSDEEKVGLKVSIDWVFGHDRTLFLSFWNHILKKTIS